MKSTTSGIYSRLKNPAVTWEEKLRLAKFAWDSEQCVIPNKQQVLLDWIVQELINTNKKRAKSINSGLLEQHWNFLLHVLQSKELVTQARIPVTLKPQLLQVFTEAFSQGEHVVTSITIDTAIKCCYIIMSSPLLASSLLAKFESYVSFLSSLLSLFTSMCLDKAQKLCLLTEVCLEKFIEVQRQQANQRKVFVSTCQQLLQPIATLRGLLKITVSQVYPKSDSSCANQPDTWQVNKAQTIIHLLELVLARSLFHKDHITEYPQALKVLKDEKQENQDEPVHKKPRISSYPKLLFDKLCELSSSSRLEPSSVKVSSVVENGTESAVWTTFPFLYEAFIKASRELNSSTSGVDFDFFTEVCQMMGVRDGTCRNPAGALPLLHQLLESVERHDVYQVAEDNANGSPHFKWLEHLTDIIVKTLEPGEVVFQCLDVLLKLNHLLLEPHLQEIWQMIWKEGKVISDAQNSLVSSLMATYFKLRQFDKLVMAILASLKNLDFSSGCHGIPIQFSKKFTEAIRGLPIGQTTAIWQIFCDEIKTNYLNNMSSTTADSPPKKSQKRKTPRHSVACGEEFEHATAIFSLFLLNTSLGGIGDRQRGSAVTLSAVKLFSATVTEILCPLLEMASEAPDDVNKKASLFPALLLRYTLGELDLYLRNMRLIEGENEATKILFSNEANDTYVPVDSMENSSVLKRDGRLAYLQSALCVQRIRALLQANKDLPHGPALSEVNTLVSFICACVDEAPDCSASWDGQTSSINSENAPVAFWDLISRHAIVLLPLFTADQQLKLAHLLIKSLTQESKPPEPVKLGYITMAVVSERMIQSADFHEIPGMQSSVAFAFWSQLQQALLAQHDNTTIVGRLSDLLTAIATAGPPTEESHKLIESKGDEADSDNEADDFDDDDNDADEADDDVDDHDDDTDDELNDADEGSLRKEDTEALSSSTRKQCPGQLQGFHKLGGEVNEILHSVLTSDSLINIPTNTAEVQRLLEVLGRLPLDWLTDENHIRCFIGLLACDIILYLHFVEEYSPELLKSLSLNRKLLKVILDGCTRRRRFILHHVMDLGALQTWLHGSATKLWRKYDMVTSDCMAGISVILSDTRELLCDTFRYLLKLQSQTVSVEQNIVSKQREELQTFASELQGCPKSSVEGIVTSHRVVTLLTGGVLAVCEEIVSNKTSSQKVVRASASHIMQLGPSLLELLRTIVEVSRKQQESRETQDGDENRRTVLHCTLCKFPDLIDSFTSLLHIYSISQQSRKLRHVKEDFEEWEWQEVFHFTLTGVIHHLFGRDVQLVLPSDENETKTVYTCLRYLKIVCLSCSFVALNLPVDFHIRLLASTLQLLKSYELHNSQSSGDNVNAKPQDGAIKRGVQEPSEVGKGNISNVKTRTPSDNKELVEEAYHLMVCLFDGCEPGRLPDLIQGLCDEITTRHIHEACLPRLTVALRVWLRLLSGRFTKNRRKELRPKLPQVLFAVQFVLQELKIHNVDLVILALDVLVKILSLGKGMLLPHNALLVLHSSLMVNVSTSENSFPRLFESQFSLLSTLLYQHSEAVYGAIHVFINCVRNLLFGLLQVCDEQEQVEENSYAEERSENRTTTLNQADLLSSAQRMARLYQEMSSHKTTFSKYSPYMIADYIHKVQTVAIPAVIRDALIPGMYCLLDICSEHELSLLHAVLEKGSRELFQSLHADYNKYHKFKGKV